MRLLSAILKGHGEVERFLMTGKSHHTCLQGRRQGRFRVLPTCLPPLSSWEDYGTNILQSYIHEG